MRHTQLVILTAVMWAGLSGQQARADVKLPALFSDGMVLQSGPHTPIWGTAGAGEEVSVILEMPDGKAFKEKPAQAGSDGHWHLTFAEDLKPGGPFTLTISGKNTITLHDVYIGEVWICSGQSNMEWHVRMTTGAEEAIQKSKNAKIRLFTVA